MTFRWLCRASGAEPCSPRWRCEPARSSGPTRAVFHRLRRELDEQMGLEPSQQLRDMEVAILRQDPALDPPPSAIACVTQLTPAQLPSPVPGFAGRHAERCGLETIRSAATRGTSADSATVIISAVSGTAGVGKTALAVYWAHQVAEHFPDGQLFVNLQGFGPDGAALSPATAVRGFLDALGVPPARIPGGLPAQTAMYRSLLAGRRVLVLLDNARDAA